MQTDLSYDPDYAVPVWETIEEWMEQNGDDIRSLAKRMAVGGEHEICEGHAADESDLVEGYVSYLEILRQNPTSVGDRLLPAVALGLQRATGITAEFWHSRHAVYMERVRKVDPEASVPTIPG